MTTSSQVTPIAPDLRGIPPGRVASVRSVPGAGRLPARSEWLLALFHAYTRRYVRRHFNAVRVDARAIQGLAADRPLLLFLNHASWWDPLICLLLSRRFFPGRPGFAPMDAAALQRYRFLGRLGFFGVEQGTTAGARQFLRIGRQVLSQGGTTLWLTPQGRFADVRERPPTFQAGLAHLAADPSPALAVPVAIEYTFWQERLPEVLVDFGAPVGLGELGGAPREWDARLSANLAAVQDRLASRAVAREASHFTTILQGRAGVGGVYDFWRWVRARLTGRRFDPHHEAA